MNNTTNTDLRAAAQAVIDRWDTPLWKDAPATAEYIRRLRAALAAPAQAYNHADVTAAHTDGYKLGLAQRDALRCAVGNCKFNGEVDKHATGCSAAASNEEALLKALTEATRSLETIQLMAGKDDYLQDMAQVRAYATSRAMVANAAIKQAAHGIRQGGRHGADT